MSKQIILSILIAAIPLSYILGTFVVNLNILIIIIAGISLYIKGNKFKISDIDKLILIFFLYIIITGTWNTLEIIYIEKVENHDFAILTKSLLFIRYLLLYLAIRLFIEKNLINFKIILYSFAAFSLFVSLDIILQFYYGKDIFGIENPFKYKTTGPFYTEAIAGGFIQKFSFFLFFAFFIYSKIKNIKFKVLILTLLFFITTLSIIFSGNRMPLLLFFLGVFLIFLSKQTLKKYVFHILILVFVMSALAINSNTKLKTYYNSIYSHSKNMISLYSYRILGIGKDMEYYARPFYVHEFDAGIATWKMNKFIGGGLKSFRYNCPKRKIEPKYVSGKVSRQLQRTTCNMHPHNYYLEILTDLGIVGIILFSYIVLKVIRRSYKSTLYGKVHYILSPFFYVLLLEIFPVRTSGSFFTTNNAIIIFLFLATVVGLTKKSKLFK